MKYSSPIFIILLFLASVLLAQPENRVDSIKNTTNDSSYTSETNYQLSDSVIAATNVTYAKAVLQKYLNAIGTEDFIRKVYNRITSLEGLVEGVETKIVFYQQAPNKICQEITAGNVFQKIIFDGTRGTKLTGDIEQEIIGDDLVKLRYDAILNLMLDPENYGLKLKYEGLEKVDNQNNYVISLTLPNETVWLQYYDIETGLKNRDSKEIVTPLGKFQQITEFDDYRSVEGVLYPFKLKQFLGNQTLDFSVDSIEVNKEIPDEVFLID